MDSTAATPRLGTEPIPAEPIPADVVSYLADVRQAQFDLLEVLASAATRLPASSRQLSAMTAVTARMARQLFDAQRSVLQREAQLDARINGIERDTAAAGRSLRRTVEVAVQHDRVGSLDLESIVAELVGPSPMVGTADSSSERQTVAHLGVEVLRSLEDAESMRDLLEAAFAVDEPDASATASALAAVLDQWWSARDREHAVAVADAQARRRLTLHLAMLEARHIARSHVSTMACGSDAEDESAANSGQVCHSVDLDASLDAMEPIWADDRETVPVCGAVVMLDGAPLPTSWRERSRAAEVDTRRSSEPLRLRRLTMAWTR